MKKLIPYFLITLAFGVLLFFKHPQIFQYKFNSTLVRDYLRSQDIEDPESLIKDRIFLSDSDIYIASGYLYAKGVDPSSLNLHPPLIKYLFGFSTLLTGNPYFVQMIFGLVLLFLTYLLGTKIFKNKWLPLIPAVLLLIDPVFGSLMNEALLDLGQAVFALGYVILALFYPGSYILQGVVLGLFAASKFWSTTLIYIMIVAGYRIFVHREKLNYKGIFLSFLIAFIIFALTYIVSFVNAGGLFNIFAYQGRVIKFMLTHNSAKVIGGPIILFMTGYFAPWWQTGVIRSDIWSLLWPVGLGVGVFGAFREFRERVKNVKFFIYLLPFIYLLFTSTQVPFTRYFILILPFVYLGLAEFLGTFFKRLDNHK